MGIIWTIIIGFIAGIVAKFLMPGKNEPQGFVLTAILGIVGALALNAILAVLGISLGAGWIAYLVAGFIGACLLIFVARAVRR